MFILHALKLNILYPHTNTSTTIECVSTFDPHKEDNFAQEIAEISTTILICRPKPLILREEAAIPLFTADSISYHNRIITSIHIAFQICYSRTAILNRV